MVSIPCLSRQLHQEKCTWWSAGRVGPGTRVDGASVALGEGNVEAVVVWVHHRPGRSVQGAREAQARLTLGAALLLVR